MSVTRWILLTSCYTRNFRSSYYLLASALLLDHTKPFPKLRPAGNKHCRKPTLTTDLSCWLYLTFFLNLEFLQDQVLMYFRIKQKGANLRIITLNVLCNVLPTASDQSQVAFQKSVSCTAHLNQRKLFLSWFRFQMYTKEVTLIL